MRKLFGLGVAGLAAQAIGDDTVDRRNSLNKPAEFGRRVRGQRNIPRPYVRHRWSPDIPIATIPSVVQTGAGASGPSRTVHALRAQLPPRGAGLILGTARAGLARGLGQRLTELERLTRHTALRGQAQPPQATQPYEGASVAFGLEGEVENVYFRHGQVVRIGPEDTEVFAIDEAAVHEARARAERRPELERFFQEGPFGIPSKIRRLLGGR